MALVKGAAFSRACASVSDSSSWRWTITHARSASTATRTTSVPATSSRAATISNAFHYRCPDRSFARWEGFADRLLRAVQQDRQLLEQFPFALLDGAHVAVQLRDALCPPALGLEVERPF